MMNEINENKVSDMSVDEHEIRVLANAHRLAKWIKILDVWRKANPGRDPAYSDYLIVQTKRLWDEFEAEIKRLRIERKIEDTFDND